MKFSIALVLVAAPAVWAADPVPMNIKTGQWEMTMTRQVSGLGQSSRPMPQIPADKLAQLPPEQRARIEAMLANAGAGGAPTVYKSCITKENLSEMQSGQASSGAANCKNTVVSSSSTKQVIQSECVIGGAKRLTTATFEALGQDSVKFTIVSNPSDGAKADSPAAAMSLNISGTSKWLGPVCTDSK
jgi:hypothetical protein